MKKWALIGLVLAAGIVALGIYLTNRQHEAPLGPSPEEKLVAFYENEPFRTMPGYHHVGEAAFWIRYYCRPLGIEGQLETLLAMAHRESYFDPLANDNYIVGEKRRSEGILQTRVDYRQRLIGLWRAMGIEIGPVEEVRGQCAMGVMEYYLHLKAVKWDVWKAVKNYNGSGPKAEDYRDKVFRSRKKIFGVEEPVHG